MESLEKISLTYPMPVSQDSVIFLILNIYHRGNKPSWLPVIFECWRVDFPIRIGVCLPTQLTGIGMIYPGFGIHRISFSQLKNSSIKNLLGKLEDWL